MKILLEMNFGLVLDEEIFPIATRPLHGHQTAEPLFPYNTATGFQENLAAAANLKHAHRWINTKAPSGMICHVHGMHVHCVRLQFKLDLRKLSLMLTFILNSIRYILLMLHNRFQTVYLYNANQNW